MKLMTIHSHRKSSFSLFPHQLDPSVVVAGGGEDVLEEGVQAEYEAGGVDAGMAGVGGDPFQVAVDDQAHMMIPVVDQSHRRDCARMNAEVSVHMLRGCEREARAAQLRRQVFSLEGFVGRHHQQIEIGLLLVGQKEILEYGCSGLFPHSLTFLHGERRRMA